jgi:hypothetical protein
MHTFLSSDNAGKKVRFSARLSGPASGCKGAVRLGGLEWGKRPHDYEAA